MLVEVFGRRAAAVRAAADTVSEFISEEEAPVLGLAAGATMGPLYEELVRRHRQKGSSWGRVTAYLLDEYVGLPADDSRLFENWLRERLARRVDLPEGALRGPVIPDLDSSPEEQEVRLRAEAARYDREVAEAGVGLQLLGIGCNGHIAFNEPASASDSRTRVVELSESTRRAAASRFAPDLPPARAMTQGMGTILQAERLLLLAFGPDKAEAVGRALEGPVTPLVPASLLRLHPRMTVLLDRLASAHLAEIRAG